MDTKRIHEDITQLLYKIEEQYGRIIHFKDSIPMLEVDLALKDVRDLYECLLDLRTATELKRRQQSSPSTRETSEPVAVKPPVINDIPAVEPKIEAAKAEEKVEEIQVEAPVNILPESEPAAAVMNEAMEEAEEAVIAEHEEEEKPEEIVAEIKDVDAASLDEKSGVSALDRGAVVPPSAFPSSSDKPPVVAPKKDLLQERQKDFVPTVRKIEFKSEPAGTEQPKKESLFDKAASLYDKIAKPGEKTVATQASRQPISNIKSAIGINEKFIYLKDLFKNNINDYNEALDKLNNFDNYEEAEDYFQDLKLKYGWDPDSKSFTGLADLLSRRYLHNASS
ncbi:MAG: hypothetical protein R2850_13135 [Bacteroidia bacterium]